MKKFLNNIKSYMIKAYESVKKGIIYVLEMVDRYFYSKYFIPILTKIGYALSHNFIFRKTNQHLIFFSKLKITITRKRREAYYGLMFIFIWIIGFIIFTLYPMFYSLYLSFQQAFYNLETGITSTPVGFQNYLSIARSQTLLPLYATYIGKMMLAVPLIVVFSIMIAVLINNPIKLKGIWRTIFFLPVVIATGPVIGELANQDATSLPSLQDSNLLLTLSDNLGEWLANPIEVLLTSMLLILWYAGIPILIFLAGLQKIDHSIYEAASIDGASPWDRFWKITLPSVKPLISVAIIYIVVSMSLFVEPGGILDWARVHMRAGTPTSNQFFGYGYASAIAWIYFLLMVIIMLIFVGLLSIKRRDA